MRDTAAEPDRRTGLDEAVGELISSPQFRLTYAQKRERLLPLLRRRSADCVKTIPALRRYVEEMRFAAEAADYADLPYLPVSAFKAFVLSSVPEVDVVRVVQSSATTSGTPSRIYLDKATAFRQSRALAAILIDVLGAQRRPFLVLDTADVVRPGPSLTARGAAIRGLEPFASTTVFALKPPAGAGRDLEPDTAALETFFAAHAGVPVLLFGFSFIVWLNVIEPLRRRGIRFAHPELTLLHTGGWKALARLEVDKRAFAAGAAEVFGCDPAAVRDFYGMAEQVGVVFVDCEAGNKHTPNFAEILIRDFVSLSPAPRGAPGLIQVMSALPSSYPGQALLTEDVGAVQALDDCPCGRRGLAFRFRSRVERTEVRGCGDTFAAAREVAAPASPAAAPPSSSLDVLLSPPGIELPEDGAAFPALRAHFTAGELPLARVPRKAIVALIDRAAQRMLGGEFRGIPGIAFLVAWLSARNLERTLRTDLGGDVEALDRPLDVEGATLRAAPRGIVAHWVAGNVPTLPFFSWTLATLGKNASIVRVTASARDAARRLFGALDGIAVEVDGRTYSGGVLLASTCVLTFPSDDAALNQALSLAADARVIWGGSEAIAAVTALPRLEHAEDVIFGPKFSLAVVDADALRDARALREAAHQLARDVVLFEQRACSSPQVLFVEGDPGDLDALTPLLEALADELTEAGRRAPRRALSEAAAADIVRVRAAYGLRADARVRAAADLSFTLLLDGTVTLPDAVQERTLFIKVVSDLGQVIPLLGPKIQAVGVAMTEPGRRARFVEEAALRGVSRLTSLGAMHHFAVPWDGVKPISRLVRWTRL